MQRTIQEFQRQAELKQIKFWPIHKCSICGYQCGFIFQAEGVYYDNGCTCIYYPPSQREWADVAEHYNLQTDPRGIAEMDHFWGFETEIINIKKG